MFSPDLLLYVLRAGYVEQFPIVNYNFPCPQLWSAPREENADAQLYASTKYQREGEMFPDM